MSAATILFTDIVRFSDNHSAEQRRLVDSLTNEVVHRLRSLLSPPMGAPDVLAFPTGDGMAVAFLHGRGMMWDRSTLLELIYHLQDWANRETTLGGVAGLRIGVHTGPVEFITDVNQRPNICGHTINLAQRVMDAADPKQVLFSEAAFREHIGNADRTYSAPPYPDGSKAEFTGPIEIHAKHGLQLLVYKMTIDPQLEWWSNRDPASKDLIVVSLAQLPKEIVGLFGGRLGSAESVGLIQLTGDRLLESLDRGDVRLSANLKRLWVFMPDPEVYTHLHLSACRASSEFVAECVGRWKSTLGRITAEHPKADLKLGLFREPPYFGASFLDWERKGGRVHVSPYVWNTPAPDCPAYELEWLGSSPSPVYEVYVEALHYLNSQTVNALS